MSFKYRTEIYQKIINFIENTNYIDTNESLFDRVAKYPVDLFDGYICSVQVGSRNISSRDLTFDQTDFQFDVIFGEDFDGDVTQEELDQKVDRLVLVEDALYVQLQKIPIVIQADNFKIISIDNLNTQKPLIEDSPRGLSLVFNISFSLKVDINTKTV